MPPVSDSEEVRIAENKETFSEIPLVVGKGVEMNPSSRIPFLYCLHSELIASVVGLLS
jgi:hypothetical protein